MNVKVHKVRADAVLPVYATDDSAGADLFACISPYDETTIFPSYCSTFNTGISVEIPIGMVGLVFARSGLACKRGLAPANCVGVIDSDYRGEILVTLRNSSKIAQTVKHGDRIAQLVIVPYYKATFVETDSLTDTKRGNGGFGSTGK